MPFANINIKQSRQIVVNGASPSYATSFLSPVTAGSLLVFIGSALDGSSDQSARLGTPTGGGGTWQQVTNVRGVSDYGPNPCGAIMPSATAGSPTITLPFTSNGSSSFTDLRISGVILEIENANNSSPHETGGPRTNLSSVGATTTTVASGSGLSQTDILMIGCVGGYIGIPSNPSGAGFTSLLSQQNGAFPGSQVSWKKLTVTSNQDFSVSHEPAVGVPGGGLAFLIKAADAGTLIYEFLFPATGTDAMPSGQTGIRMVVARNFDPFVAGGTYEHYGPLTAETGTAPGDSTSRRVLVSSGLPSGAALGQTLRASVETSDGNFGAVGWIPGTIKSV